MVQLEGVVAASRTVQRAESGRREGVLWARRWEFGRRGLAAEDSNVDGAWVCYGD